MPQFRWGAGFLSISYITPEGSPGFSILPLRIFRPSPLGKSCEKKAVVTRSPDQVTEPTAGLRKIGRPSVRKVTRSGDLATTTVLHPWGRVVKKMIAFPFRNG